MAVVRVDLSPLPATVKGEVTYAACFASERMSDVRWDGDCLLIERQSDCVDAYFTDVARWFADRFTRAETAQRGRVL